MRFNLKSSFSLIMDLDLFVSECSLFLDDGSGTPKSLGSFVEDPLRRCGAGGDGLGRNKEEL